RRASTANRVARSRSSSGYFLGAAMTLILACDESLHQTRRETRAASQAFRTLRQNVVEQTREPMDDVQPT
ncbi:MAG: hypothetical protein JWM64_936, partial [Frankiales bacterium]|nr:hypothetical protein [Frankiales bacterium]